MLLQQLKILHRKLLLYKCSARLLRWCATPSSTSVRAKMTLPATIRTVPLLLPKTATAARSKQSLHLLPKAKYVLPKANAACQKGFKASHNNKPKVQQRLV